MNHITCRLVLAALLGTSFALPADAAEPPVADALARSFAQPPDSTKPRCYWYWMDGQITKEGITRDLEAMKRVGIGEGYIGVIGGQSGTPAVGRSKALTPPAIAGPNTGVHLPDSDIVVVHRSDGSGTTYIWVDYLSKVSDEWKTKVGKNTSVNWPVGLGGKGNEGVAGWLNRLPEPLGMSS